ncbi:MAG TPA: DEAD/DEAH box helicase [Bryobacteraceae bacterium]|nr:DEAD/DEAH box helicase [Bryobacteraceae bacterium]
MVEQKANQILNFALDFGEPRTAENALTIPPPSPLSAFVGRFEQLMTEHESPVRAIRHQPARAARYSPFPVRLDPKLQTALQLRGIEKLYLHQAAAVEHSLDGQNVAVVTPTASGKTLCYNLPVVQTILANPAARAVYLFPTKALAEDQRLELQRLNDAIGGPLTCHTYDGDTPSDARRSIRDKANVVLTNPDMLHTGILPHHTKWVKLFENLEYFIIDELHYYRGVYGSHLANVLRRLKRICEFYGTNPKFICCSATIANPKELAESITAEPFELVSENGAPSGDNYFVFYNPPVVNQQLGIRRSYLHETRRVALEFVRQNAQTLVFTNNRLATEILTTYLKDACAQLPFSHEAVRGYRGGYLPKERRHIEAGLREGVIRAVIATNALELGVDIGSLDSVVLAGYPGNIASTWQRAGRAGRRSATSVAVLVASSAPLDQYIIEHPDYFFGNSPEEAHINADNLEIFLNHLKCAAFELPIRDGETFGGQQIEKLCRFLAEDLQLLHHSGDCWHWVSDSYPADSVSLRAVSSDNFLVIDVTEDHKIIGEVDFPSALTTLHEKAIYLHDARQFQVEKLDFDGRKAFVRRVDSDYFTDAIVYTQVSELSQFEAVDWYAHGEVRVKRQVVGFKKIKFYTLENVGAGLLSLPEQEMHTTAFWLHLSAGFFSDFAGFSTADLQDSVHGAGNVLKTVASVLLLSDPRDLAVTVLDDSAQKSVAFEPDIVLYDNYPGGIGQSDPLFRRREELLRAALDLASSCKCEAGCPSCVGPHNEIGHRGKEGAIRILEKLNCSTV